MEVVGKIFKFEDVGFSCSEIRGIVPHEKFVSISKFKDNYTIRYQEKNKTKKVCLDIGKRSHSLVDDFLKANIPNMTMT